MAKRSRGLGSSAGKHANRAEQHMHSAHLGLEAALRHADTGHCVDALREVKESFGSVLLANQDFRDAGDAQGRERARSLRQHVDDAFKSVEHCIRQRRPYRD